MFGLYTIPSWNICIHNRTWVAVVYLLVGACESLIIRINISFPRLLFIYSQIREAISDKIIMFMKKVLFLLFVIFVVQARASEDPRLTVGDLQYRIVNNYAMIIKYIGQGTSCVIPETVEYENVEYPVLVLGERAFSNASNLISITLSNNLSENDRDFTGCINLQEFIVNNDNIHYSTIDGVLFSKDKTYLSLYPYGRKGKYIIPEGISGIARYAFNECTGLTSLTLPNSLITVNYDSFYNCTNLKEYYVYDDNPQFSTNNGALFSKDKTILWLYPIGKEGSYSIPEETKSIKGNAFYNCTNLISVVFPENLQSIGDYAFSYCNSLVSITLPKNLRSIGFGAFDNCTNLTTVILPESLQEIRARIFSNCTNITSITLPNSWTSIPSYLIEDCLNLTEYLVRDNNPNFCSINGVLFSKDKTELKLCPLGKKGNYVIPEGTTKIASGAFSKCIGLTSITFPNSLKSIDANAFNDCINLIEYLVNEDNPNFCSIEGILFSKNKTELTLYPIGKKGDYVIPEGTLAVNYGAFSSCTGLTSLTFPNSLKSIPTNAFNGCVNLMEDLVNEDNPNYCSIDGVLYSKDKTKLILYPTGKKGNYMILNGTKTIATGAFQYCINLTSVSIPNSLTKIETDAFNGSSLKYINIPETVTSIGDNVFYNCTSLKAIVIPTSVGNNIGKNILSYCWSLRYVFSYAALERHEEKNNPFGNMTSSVIIFCPANYTSNYRSMYSEGTIADIEKCFWNFDTSATTQGAISFKLNPNSYWKQSDKIAIKRTYLLSENDTIDAEQNKDTYKFKDLMPNQAYNVQLNFDILDCNLTIYPSLKTQNIGLISKELTQIKLILSIKAEDIPVTDKYLYYRTKGKSEWKSTSNISSNTVTVAELIPGTTYECYASVYVNGKYYNSTTLLNGKTAYQEFTTKSLNPRILDPIVGQTIFSCSGDYEEGDATVEGFGFTGDWINGEYYNLKELRLTGLNPDTKYKIVFSVKTKQGGITKTEYAFTTNTITITSQPADAISNTSVTLNADLDCDAESGYGFEWRKYDAPDMVPSNTVQAEKIKDKIAFRLVNLSPSTYYKYRPFYKSASEKMYYGEWIAFGTADVPVLFAPTVETLDYRLDKTSETNVIVYGYVLAGSESILQQGFEYWMALDTNHKEVLSSGTNMEVEITGLLPNTTYKYRAFAKTASGTTYGEESEFTTGKASGIESNKTTDFQVSLYPNPALTETVLQISGAETGIISYTISDLNGRLLLSDKKDANHENCIPIDTRNLSEGIYIIRIIHNDNFRTIKMKVK